MNGTKGSMEGWFEDESYCEGRCGMCEDCDNAFYESCDYEEDED
jgi:hypothetical protein